MEYLLSKKGFRHLVKLKKLKPLLAFDFDGTLTPIVSDPSTSRLNRDVQKLLVSLSRHYRVVIISGRSLSDLRRRLKTRNILLIGNHGSEGILDKKIIIKLELICKKWIISLIENEDYLKMSRSVKLENKNSSLSIHYRMAKNKSFTKKKLLLLISKLNLDARVIEGKDVINLLPSGSIDKGIALTKLMKLYRAKQALYVGDDVTDEDVFRIRNKRITKVRVYKSTKTQARFYLKNQHEIIELLSYLIEPTSNKSVAKQ